MRGPGAAWSRRPVAFRASLGGYVRRSAALRSVRTYVIDDPAGTTAGDPVRRVDLFRTWWACASVYVAVVCRRRVSICMAVTYVRVGFR